MNRQVLVVIPTRMQSRRLPGKPMICINRYPLIHYTHAIARQSGYRTVIATHDKEIADYFFMNKNVGGSDVCMTSDSPTNGTERCQEVASFDLYDLHPDDIIVNVQGDMIFFDPNPIIDMVNILEKHNVFCVTCITELKEEEIKNPSRVKCVIDYSQEENCFTIQQFSRTPIQNSKNYLHVGMYAYKVKDLEEYALWGTSPNELLHKLEQYRILDNGRRIATTVTMTHPITIDTADDLDGVSVKLTKAIEELKNKLCVK